MDGLRRRREERLVDNERLVGEEEEEEGGEMPGNYTPLPASLPAQDSFHFCQVRVVCVQICVFACHRLKSHYDYKNECW